MIVQECGDSFEFADRETFTLPKAHRASQAIQIKDSFMLRTLYVDMFRPVIVRIDDYAKIAKSQDGWHRRRIAYS